MIFYLDLVPPTTTQQPTEETTPSSAYELNDDALHAGGSPQPGVPSIPDCIRPPGGLPRPSGASRSDCAAEPGGPQSLRPNDFPQLGDKARLGDKVRHGDATVPDPAHYSCSCILMYHRQPKGQTQPCGLVKHGRELQSGTQHDLSALQGHSVYYNNHGMTHFSGNVYRTTKLYHRLRAYA